MRKTPLQKIQKKKTTHRRKGEVKGAKENGGYELLRSDYEKGRSPRSCKNYPSLSQQSFTFSFFLSPHHPLPLYPLLFFSPPFSSFKEKIYITDERKKCKIKFEIKGKEKLKQTPDI